MDVRLSLKQAWTALILFAVLVPVTIVMIWYGQDSYDKRLNTALTIERHKHELLRYQIESEVVRFKTLLKNKSDSLSLLVDRVDNPKALKEINSLLDLVVAREQAIRGVMIMSGSSRVITAIDPMLSVTGDKMLSAERLQFVATQWGFNKTYAIPEIVIPLSGRVYIGSPQKHGHIFAFSMAAPIGKPAKAVLIAIIEADKLWPTTVDKKHAPGDETTTNYILDRRGSLVTTVKGGEYVPGALMTHMAVARSALIGSPWPEETAYIGINSQPVFGTITAIPVLNWTLVSEVPTTEITQPIFNALTKLIILTLLGVIVFVWIVLYLSRQTLKPIQHACVAIDQVARGDYEITLKPTGIRELDAMTSGITRMTKARQAAENALQDSENELQGKEKEQREILNSIVDAAISIDENGAILSFNKAAEHLFGYSFDEIRGQNINRLMPEPYTGEHDGYLQRYMQTGEAHVIGLGREVEGLRKNKETFPMQIFVAELPEGTKGKRRFIGSCVDLTHIKQQEEQLRRSQRMDALGKLTGGIAHDYNNILGIVLGYAELINDSPGDADKAAKYSQTIKHAAERGSVLAEKLLSFSRHKKPDLMAMNINTLLQEQRQMLEITLTGRIKFTLELSEDLWQVELDSGDLEDAIINMSINALHAMKSGGQLTIRTSNEQLNATDVKCLGISSGDYVLLSITDTGSGMDAVTREKLFDPFYTTKGEQGTGLGLSQVYGFVKRSGGTLKVYSELGHGSRFALYFPRSDQPTTTTGSAPLDVTQDLRGNDTLLLVDDEQGLVDLAYDILTPQGYRVLTANDGEQALAVLEKETVDLLISDVIMPNMDGYQLAAQVRKHYPRIKLQMVSGFADERHDGAVDKTLHENMLYKPYASNILLMRVRKLLNEGCTSDVLSNRTILIMDDDKDIQELYKIYLTKIGCKVVTVFNGEDALGLYKNALGTDNPIDLMIVDLSVPNGMGGKEVSDEVRKIHPQAKVIVASGNSESPEMMEPEDYGFDGALEKNFDVAQIKRVLEQALWN